MFLSALNEDSPWLQFDVTSSGSFLVESRKGHTAVYLQIDSPKIKQAREMFERSPEQLPLLRYILVDVARHDMRKHQTPKL